MNAEQRISATTQSAGNAPIPEQVAAGLERYIIWLREQSCWQYVSIDYGKFCSDTADDLQKIITGQPLP